MSFLPDAGFGRPACRRRRRFGSLVAAAAFFSAAATAGAQVLPAFPGADGQGHETQGGRGGVVVAVTNLDDDGPGSLRACAAGAGPRNCVFRVSGVIVLKRSLLVDGERSGSLSILGQTAPGAGITITVDKDATNSMRTPLVLRNTHDIVVRHLRLRSQAPSDVANVDALTIEDSRRVYVDHVSGSWATDENVNTYGQTTDVTIAYSIFGEGLRRHSKCALLGSKATGPQRISFWRNLCISNNDRNPDNNHFGRSCIEITDNLFYNARSEWAEVFTQYPEGTSLSYVGNYFKAGPSTLQKTYAIKWDDAGSVAHPTIFAEANVTWSPPAKQLMLVTKNALPFMVDRPPCPSGTTTTGDGMRSYVEVLTHAGAFPRDEVDRRYVREVGELGVEGTGSLKAKPGRIAPIPASTPYKDVDGDGIADSVEASFQAEPGRHDAWYVHDEDGWSSFDRFMQWLSDERLAGRYPE